MGISTQDERQGFVKRLRQACERNPNIPPEHMGRQSAIAATLGVVPEAVSRWFKGETMPNSERMRALAKMLGVDIAWLALGHGDASPVARESSSRRTHASVLYVRSLMTMHGINIADVPVHDPNYNVVSFYALIDGELFPFIVTHGTLSEPDTFTVTVPANYEAGHVICVIPRGVNPVLLRLSSRGIKRNKHATEAGIVLTIRDAGSGNYMLGSHVAYRIRSFATLAEPVTA